MLRRQSLSCCHVYAVLSCCLVLSVNFFVSCHCELCWVVLISRPIILGDHVFFFFPFCHAVFFHLFFLGWLFSAVWSCPDSNVSTGMPLLYCPCLLACSESVAFGLPGSVIIFTDPDPSASSESNNKFIIRTIPCIYFLLWSPVSSSM